MAAAFVKGAVSLTGTASFAAGTAAAGNLLVGAVLNGSATIGVLPAGYTDDGSASSGGVTTRSIHACHMIAAGGETGATFTGTVFQTVIMEFSGIDQVNPLAAGATPTICANPVSGTAQATGTVAITAAQDVLYVAIWGLRSSSTPTWSGETAPGSVAMTENLDSNGVGCASVEVASSGTGGAGTATASTALTGENFLAAFLVAGAAITLPPHPLVIDSAVDRAANY